MGRDPRHKPTGIDMDGVQRIPSRLGNLLYGEIEGLGTEFPDEWGKFLVFNFADVYFSIASGL